MRIIHIDSDRREQWDALAAREPSFALLQSWAWGELKARAGWRVCRVAAERAGELVAGAQLLVRPLAGGLVSVAYVPRGPIGAWLDEGLAGRLLDELHRVARRSRAIFMRVEPPLASSAPGDRALRRLGLRPSPQSNQPRATLLVDLRPAPDELLAAMHHKTRYNIRYAARRGVELREGGAADLPAFQRLIEQTGRRAGFSPRSPNYYRDEWAALAPRHLRLLIASYQGRPIAANVAACFGEHAAYLHGASSGEHANLQPNALLMWQALQWARERGCRSFDLWGIPEQAGLAEQPDAAGPPPGGDEGLWGVYRFKRGFSRQARLYIGAYDYVYSAPGYALIANQLISGARLEQVAVWIDSLRPA